MSAKIIYTQSQEFQGAVETYNTLGNTSIQASHDQCMLLARMQQKLADSVGGNVQSKEYRKGMVSIQVDTNLKKAQCHRDIQIGRYLIENQERNPNLSTMDKTKIYKEFIVQPKPRAPSKPKAPIVSIDALQTEINSLKNERDFLREVIRDFANWADTKTRTKFDGICEELGINPKSIH